MKNEYQEALDYIKHDLEHNDFIRYKNGNQVDKYHREVLLKLVDKEIPMKPIEYDGQIPWVSYNCPNCLWTISSVMKESYCETCGQKIDWSDEE